MAKLAACRTSSVGKQGLCFSLGKTLQLCSQKGGLRLGLHVQVPSPDGIGGYCVSVITVAFIIEEKENVSSADRIHADRFCSENCCTADSE